jgi:WD40 repeat protein
MAFDPVNKVFATGQLGPKPTVYIWDSKDMIEISALKGGLIKGVECLSFSPDGSKLACVCIDDNHMVVVFDT